MSRSRPDTTAQATLPRRQTAARDASRRRQSRFAVLASIGANVAIATVKFIVAALTHSTAMLAEGVHSLANCFDGSLLLLGEFLSRRPPDEEHPFGYGRELYFWSFVVAVVFFALGAGLTLYEGVRHVMHPPELGPAKWSYVVLGGSALFDGASFVIGFKQFRRDAKGRGYWRAVRESKNPTLISVVLEDTADLLGLACAFVGVFLSHKLHMPALDGFASIAIGLILAALAFVLLVETHGLLIGESAQPELVAQVCKTARQISGVQHVERTLTVHTGPDEVVLVLQLDIDPRMSVDELRRQMRQLEERLHTEHPELKRIFFAIGDGDSSGAVKAPTSLPALPD
jgi:cation diffusion facilitator family transporter